MVSECGQLKGTQTKVIVWVTGGKVMVRGRIGTGDRRKDQGGKVPCLVQESGTVGFVLSLLDAMVRGTTRQLLLIATGQNRL